VSNELTILYRIDSNDEIIFVNEMWFRLVVIGDTSKLFSDKILNHSLWDFMGNNTRTYLYRVLLEKVRTGITLRFNIRCSSVGYNQILELTITPQLNGEIQFEIRPLRQLEMRTEKVNLRDDAMLIICSWCNRINIKSDDWLEAEKAIVMLKLFELEKLPNLSHGMCNDCYQIMCSKLFETKK
jgi:hypothetical protein